MSVANEHEPAGATVPLLTPRNGVPEVVTTAAGVAAAAEALAAGSGPLAVDAERASGFRYSARAYLVQLRRAGAGTVLLDPIPTADALAPLAAAINDLEWVLHSADQDLPGLDELGLRPAVLYDTELAGRLAGFDRVGLAAIVERTLGFELRKGHGAADWSTRPLPDAWLNYAALDVEILVELRDAMAAELEQQGKSEWAAQEFEHIRRAGPPAPKPDRWRRTSRIHTLKDPRRLAIVRELWTARDELAARRDIAPGRVLPDSAIVAAAEAAPVPSTSCAPCRSSGGRGSAGRRGCGWERSSGPGRCRNRSCHPLHSRSPARRRPTAGPGTIPTPPRGSPRPVPRSPSSASRSRCRWRISSAPNWCAGCAGSGGCRRIPTSSRTSRNGSPPTGHGPGSGS